MDRKEYCSIPKMTQTIITAYHHGFAGGSKNTSRLLHSLAQRGIEVEAFFFETPHYFTYTPTRIKRHVMDRSITSEVISPASLDNYYLTEQIVEQIRQVPNATLFAANLFPYGNVMLDATLQSKQFLLHRNKLVLHPVGSDIWQIGKHLKSRVRWMLEHEAVDHLITYSAKFASEINEYYNISRAIDIVPPLLERSVFCPLSSPEITQRRQKLSLTEDTFIIHHHSSMRRVKCPEVVLDIAQKAAEQIDHCILIMSGSIPWSTLQTLEFPIRATGGNSPFMHVSELKKLTVYWTGVVSNVEFLMQIADVELNASLHDSFNLALMEAMACGIPVVTSDVVGIAPHIEAAGGGYCFPTYPPSFDELEQRLYQAEDTTVFFDVDYAVECIVHLYHNPALATQQGCMGSLYVHDQFSEERVVNEFSKYL